MLLAGNDDLFMEDLGKNREVRSPARAGWTRAYGGVVRGQRAVVIDLGKKAARSPEPREPVPGTPVVPDGLERSQPIVKADGETGRTQEDSEAGREHQEAPELPARPGNELGGGEGRASGPELAAGQTLARLRDAASAEVTALKERAEQIRTDITAGRSSDEAAAELAWIEDAVPQIEAWTEALGTAAGGGPVAQGQVAYILVMGDTITRQARRQKRAHPDSPLSGKFWKAVEKKLPWLAPSLAARAHVREWTLGFEASIPGFAKGRLDVTFGDGGDSWDPGDDDG